MKGSDAFPTFVFTKKEKQKTFVSPYRFAQACPKWLVTSSSAAGRSEAEACQRVNMLTVLNAMLRNYHEYLSQRHVLFSLIIALCLLSSALGVNEIVWAVNCGGESHTDVHGIRYEADPLDTGFASDYGKNLLIQRVVPQDQILYQTERYHLNTFSYDIPVWKDGDYVLVMKFSEVWFTSANQKVYYRRNAYLHVVTV
jgi:hypothetical protein